MCTYSMSYIFCLVYYKKNGYELSKKKKKYMKKKKML